MYDSLQGGQLAVKIVRGRLRLLEEELTQLEWQVSRCREWVKSIKVALEEAKEVDDRWKSYSS